MDRRLVGGVTVMLIAAALLWLAVRGCVGDEPGLPLAPRPNGAEGVAPAVAVSKAAAEPEAGSASDQAVAGELSREALPGAPEPDPTTGSLLVRLVWADDESPVIGIEVQASRGWSDNRVDVPSGVTDARGEVLFEGLLPGIVRPRWTPGTRRYGSPVEIKAGERAESRFVVPVGLTARGRVVDGQGQPVPAADIVVSARHSASQSVARSAADGSFSVRGLPAQCYLGARKAGFAPSPMREFTTNREVAVQVTIELRHRGGALAGRVLGPEGTPVVGARVRVGRRSMKLQRLPDGGRALAPQPIMLTSDDQGRFTADGLSPGTIELDARAPRLAPTRKRVEVEAGRMASVTLHFPRAAALEALVTDRTGEPVAGAVVRVRTGIRGHSWAASTNSVGRCAFDDLLPGELVLAADHDSHGRAEQRVDLLVGERFQWRATLGGGLELTGIVLDGAGEPVQGASVRGRLDPWVKGTDWYPSVRTDQRGRFVFNDCVPDRTVRLEAQRPNVLMREVVVRGITPGQGEVELRLPPGGPGYATGIVRGPGDRILPNVRCTPRLIGDNSARPKLAVDSRTGDFRFGGFPSGQYQLTFATDGFPPQRVTGEVRAGETWEVGTVRFAAGGRVVVQLGGTASPPAKLRVMLSDERGDFVRWLTVENGRGEWGPLAVGEYRVAVFGQDYAATAAAFEITADVTTNTTLALAAGVPVTLRAATPQGAELDGPVDLRVRDGAGQLVHRSEVYVLRGQKERAVRLRSGTYQVEASWHHHTATRSITVGSEPEVFEVVLR
ncbi:MAG: carboxypeptidase-like regulatory domain-containing protein [bacterium]|nr:carboxypeptidase-like regulatory domain-containing protein [bacterium]